MSSDKASAVISDLERNTKRALETALKAQMPGVSIRTY